MKPSIGRYVGKHYEIERFGVSIVMLVVLAVVLIVGSVSYTLRSQARTRDMTSVYTSSFALSQSGATGSVLGVYENEQRTKAVVLVKFDSTANVSMDISRWAMTVTGVDDYDHVTATPYALGAGICNYASNGYIAFVLASTDAFSNHKIACIVDTGNMISTDGSDTSSLITDTFNFTVNLGASNVKTADALDADGFDAVAFYRDVLSLPGETDARQALTDDVVDMHTELVSINEYQTRLTQAGVDVSSVTPSWVTGDSIASEGSTLSYNAKTVVDGGMSYDWATHSLSDGGYIADAMAQLGYTDVDLFFNSLKTPNAPSVGTVTWKLTDQTTLVDAISANPSSTRYTQAKSNAEVLEGLWALYGTTKAHYQGDHLYKLFSIEYDLTQIADNYTYVSSDQSSNFTIR